MQLKTSTNLEENSVIEPKELDRHKVDYVDTSQRFYSVSKDFSKQYAHIYASRLQTFRNILTDRIKKKWNNKYPVLKLCDLLDKEKHTVIVGTIYVHQNLKPSILKEISDKLEIIPQPSRTHFVHEEDTLILEDELQRIRLSGEIIKVHRVVTGVVCAVLGFEEEDGVFKVLDVCWPDCAIQKPLPNLDNDTYVVIMSGLNLASQSEQNFFAYTLLLEWLCGLCGSNEYQEEVSKIVRVIVAGGVFSCNEGLVTDVKESDVIESMSAVDNFCSVVSASAPLDLMPGCKDPTGVMLPQRPFHYCMFPKAAPYKSFNRVTNPYECDIGGFKFVGTSGEPVKNILQYSELQNSMEGMLATLQWRHLAPTAPDTVPSAPCIDTDPFTMYSCPAVYFMGNADQFSTKIYEGPEQQRVRVVCVPDFCADRTVAVVNLRTLNCYSMTFN